MKVFHCNIHGDIYVSDLALSLIDTREFQRLHYIHQMGMAYKVFPTAKHSRFEHSIGTYYLTGLLLDRLDPEGLDSHTRELIKIGGLLHDIGHGPFSHLFDNFFLKDYSGAWKHHETRSQDIFKYIVKKYNLNFTKEDQEIITEVIEPTRTEWWLNIVNNKITGIDVDKLDYIIRDNLTLGLKLNIDVNRIINNSAIIDKQICYCDRIKDDIFNLLYVRFRLYTEIYTHPTSLRFELIMCEILKDLNKDDNIMNIIKTKNVEQFCQLTDAYIITLGSPDLLDLIDRRGYLENGENHDNDDKKDIAFSFMKNQPDPFQNIYFYNRKEPNKSFKIPPSDINIFL